MHGRYVKVTFHSGTWFDVNNEATYNHGMIHTKIKCNLHNCLKWNEMYFIHQN